MPYRHREGGKVLLYAFPTSALDEGGWLTPRPGLFTLGNDPVHIVKEAG